MSERVQFPGASGQQLVGRLDLPAGPPTASVLFDAARHPKSFLSLDGADHLLTRAADARYVGEVLASWAVRYLDQAPTPPAAPSTAPGVVRVRETNDGAGRSRR